MKVFLHATCFFFITILLVSCASQNHLEFAGHYKPPTEVAKDQMTMADVYPEKIFSLPDENYTRAIASSGETFPDLNLLQQRSQEPGSSIAITEKQKTKLERKIVKVETKLEKEILQNENEFQPQLQAYKDASKAVSSADGSDVLYAILAILLPPLAVALYEDGITAHFWISILLTICFWIPGVIYALIIVLS